MSVYYTNSEAETEAVGAALAADLPGGSVVAMYGDLGAGKTAFVRGMARDMALTAGCPVPPSPSSTNTWVGGS